MDRSTDESPLRILLLGPSGAGKSAVAVQVLYRWGGLEPGRMQVLQEQREQADLTPAQLLALLHDDPSSGRGPEDQRRHYLSPKYQVSISSSPGCSFFPNGAQISEGLRPCPLQARRGSALQGACALLVVPATWGDFKAHWGLLRKQLSFVCKLHLRQLVVCVNKMDATDPPYDCQRYGAVVSKISVHLWGLGRNPNYVVFLPISALHGDNMHRASPAMSWFRGWEIMEEAGGTLRGMTLQQLLHAIVLKFRPESYYTQGAWSQEETKSLLLAWTAMAGPDSSGAPCPHALSEALMAAGVRRSPEQSRLQANFLLDHCITAQLQGKLGTCPFQAELRAILDYEATQCMLQLEKLSPGLRGLAGRTCGAGRPAGCASCLAEAEPTARESSLHQELLSAGEALGMEKGPGVRSERPRRTSEGRGELPALPECLRPPSGQKDRDPDYLLTGLKIKRCERAAWPADGQRGQASEEEEVSFKGCRCVAYRTAYFVMKRKEAGPVLGHRARGGLFQPLPLRPLGGPLPPDPALHPPTPSPSCPDRALQPASVFSCHWGHRHPAFQLPLQPAGNPCPPFPFAQPVPGVLGSAEEPLPFPPVAPWICVPTAAAAPAEPPFATPCYGPVEARRAPDGAVLQPSPSGLCDASAAAPLLPPAVPPLIPTPPPRWVLEW